MRTCVTVLLAAAGTAMCVTPLIGADKVSVILDARNVDFRVDSATYQIGESKKQHVLGPKERETLGRIVKELKAATSPMVPPPRGTS